MILDPLKPYLRLFEGLAVVALVGVIFAFGARWQSGRDQRTAAGIAAEVAKRDGTAAIALAEANQHALEMEHAAADANRRIVLELEPKLAASDAAGQLLARRLRDAIARANSDSRPVPANPDRPAPAPTGGTGSDDGLVAAAGRALGECTRNTERLDALIEAIKPQL